MKKILLITAILAAFTACKKEEEPKIATQTAIEHPLTGKTFKCDTLYNIRRGMAYSTIYTSQYISFSEDTARLNVMIHKGDYGYSTSNDTMRYYKVDGNLNYLVSRYDWIKEGEAFVLSFNINDKDYRGVFKR